MVKQRTAQQLYSSGDPRRLLKGRRYEIATAIDDVLDIVRALLYEANSHAAELALIDSLREPMGRVDK